MKKNEGFYARLVETIRKCSQNDVTILMGDFKAKLDTKPPINKKYW